MMIKKQITPVAVKRASFSRRVNFRFRSKSLIFVSIPPFKNSDPCHPHTALHIPFMESRRKLLQINLKFKINPVFRIVLACGAYGNFLE